MELFKAEAAAIRARVEEWLAGPDFELEATFKGGEVDATTFMAVAQRLRAKGYVALPQEDHLTISTPQHIRFTLTSMPVIQQYCVDNVLAGKPYIAIIKNRATAESTVDLEDYDTRIKVRRETPMAQDDAKVKEMLGAWEQQRKAFRMIRRWSFGAPGMRIDMSIVRSTRRDKMGNFRWQSKFQDQDIMAAPTTYEIEVELLHDVADTVEVAQKRLIKGIGEVLRGIQKHTVLIRNSVRMKVLAAYKGVTGTDLFRGPSLRVLKRMNFDKERMPGRPNIRDGYNVTDKADGLRTLGFVDSKGDLYLIDMGLNVYRTGLRRPELRLSMVDGEWVTKDKEGKAIQQFLAFDVFFMPDKSDVSKYPFQPGAVPAVAASTGTEASGSAPAPPQPGPPENSRHEQLKMWMSIWNKGDGPTITAAGISPETKLQVSMKQYFFAQAGNDSIFRLAARVLSMARPYYTDGLIFTANAAPLPSRPSATFDEQFKWKPPRDNTIDFLVVTEKVEGSKTQDKVTVGIKPDTGETVNYKTLKLFVGSYGDNPRDIILNGLDLPSFDSYRGAGKNRGKRPAYKPVVFVPKEFPDPTAAMCKLIAHRDPSTGEMYVRTEHSAEPIQTNTIVEMSYDPSQPPEWRWVPLRVRHDKTERYQRRQIMRTMNGDPAAQDVWDNIYDPITLSMIQTGSEQPQKAEVEALGQEAMERATIARRYYERPDDTRDQTIAVALKKFHTRWIKEQILYRVGLSGEGKQLLDLACGVAGDLHIWRRLGTKFVFGLDNASKNILGTEDSAYARYMKVVQEAGGRDFVAPMLFAIADSSKPLVSGSAGKTEQEADIMRAVFGKQRPSAPDTLPEFVKEVGAGRLKDGADCVACMFALHYFFESPEKFNGLLRNLADTMKVGGYFIGCCFDGEKVFELLRGTEKGEAKTGLEKKKVLWRIAKGYEEEDLSEGDAGFGLPVDVTFATIGMEHREYLVPFRLLEEKLRAIGCDLLTEDELKKVGMVNSTATFNISWEMAARQGQKFEMSDAAKEFSFLNRWFIFKRNRQETVAEAAAAEAAMAVRANAVAGREAAATAVPGPAVNGRAANARRNAAARSAAATAAAAGTVPGAAAQEELAAGLEAAANAAAPGRTVPVAPGSAAPAGRTYAPEEIFLFYADAAAKDSLDMKDPGAARWLAPSAPFPIQDPDDETKVYPSVEHFLAGMRVKLTTNLTTSSPDAAAALGASIFSRDGTIHQRFLNDRLQETNGGTRPLNPKRDKEMMKAEIAAVKDASRAAAIRKYGATVDEAAWATVKDAMLEEALRQRWTRDARFRRILEAARAKGKTLLYYTPGAANNMGGVLRKADSRIEGENKIGAIMMRLAGYPQ